MSARVQMECHLGTLHLRIRVEHSRSLKDKRQVFRSLKDRLGRRHNASLAEVAGHDSRQYGEIVVATVSSSPSRVAEVLERVRRDALSALGPSLLDADADIFPL